MEERSWVWWCTPQSLGRKQQVSVSSLAYIVGVGPAKLHSETLHQKRGIGGVRGGREW